MYQLSVVLKRLLISTFTRASTYSPKHTSPSETVHYYLQVADANRKLIH